MILSSLQEVLASRSLLCLMVRSSISIAVCQNEFSISHIIPYCKWPGFTPEHWKYSFCFSYWGLPLTPHGIFSSTNTSKNSTRSKTPHILAQNCCRALSWFGYYWKLSMFFVTRATQYIGWSIISQIRNMLLPEHRDLADIVLTFCDGICKT